MNESIHSAPAGAQARRITRTAVRLGTLTALFAACEHVPTAPIAQPGVPPMRGTPVTVAAVTCRGDIHASTLECAPADPAKGGARGDIILGGQGTNVKLTSSNVVVTDVPNPAVQDTFAFRVDVQNLLLQSIGTVDGVHADLDVGVRVFFAQAPEAVAGYGALEVANATGLDAFTASAQPFFAYLGTMIAPGGHTGTKLWKISYDATVTNFAFTVYVATVVQFPRGWVDVAESAVPLAPGGTAQLTAVAHDALGAVVAGEPVSWSSAVPGVAGVDASGAVAAACGGVTTVTASTATRPARNLATVTVGASFAAFSPNPYGAAGNAVDRSASLAAGFTGCVVPAAGALAVHGLQSSGARLGGSIAGGGTQAAWNHGQPFFPGEEVEMTVTTRLASAPRVARWRAAAGAATGTVAGRLIPMGSTNVNGIATGDLNGDGRMDIVAAVTGPGAVRVLLRNAAGGYDTASYNVGTFASDVAVADMNGDGRLDLAVPDRIGAVKLLFRNAGNTGYDPAVSYTMGGIPYEVALGDLDGDGKPDLVTSGSNSASVSVRLHDATGAGYGVETTYTVGSNPQGVLVADVTGDGKADVVAVNRVSYSVTVLPGNGIGGLGAGSAYTVGTAPAQVAAGDLDGDGRVDLAVSNQSQTTVSVLMGTAGGFAAAVPYTVGAGPQGVAIADVNGDGRMDIVTSNNSATSVGVRLRNAANTGFDAVQNYVAGPRSGSLAVADLDGDGRLDLATGNEGGTVSVLPRNANNTGFGVAPTFAVGAGPAGVAAGDLDGDGTLDLVTANTTAGTVSVLTRNAGGTGYANAATYTAGKTPRAVAVGDLNGDGMPDLAVLDLASSTVSVLMRNATNTGYNTQTKYGVGTLPVTLVTDDLNGSIALGDLNGDGMLDIVAQNAGSSNVSVLYYRKRLTLDFDTAVNYAVGTGPVSVAVGDVNGDGQMDIAVASRTGNNVGVMLRNAGNTGFDAPLSYAVSTAPYAIAISDLNGDGRPDIATGGTGGVSVLMRNAGNTGFNTVSTTAVTSAPVSIAIGDVNGDGKLDVITGSAAGYNVSILLRNPANTGFAASTYSGGLGTQSIAVADLNGDGRLDVVTANYTASTVTELDNIP